MIGQLNGAEGFTAQGPMVDGAIRVSCDLNGLSVFDVDEDSTPAMTHPTVAFNHGIVTVNLHLTGCIRKL
jgi:hypothetical protein